MTQHGAVFEHRIRVRYGEVDMQQVVFNAHYLAYCDDAADEWFRTIGQGDGSTGWEVMVKKAEIVWHAAARVRDELVLAVSVSRWGVTSFDVHLAGGVGDTHVFDATLTYVAVDSSSGVPVPVPPSFRAAVEGWQ